MMTYQSFLSRIRVVLLTVFCGLAGALLLIPGTAAALEQPAADANLNGQLTSGFVTSSGLPGVMVTTIAADDLGNHKVI